MIIDRETRKMLDILIAGKPDMPRHVFTYDHICEIAKMDEDDMFPVVKGLVSQGLAEYAYWDTRDEKIDMGIALTQRGRKYKELKGLESKERWKERLYGFLSGVAVTVLGGFILSWLAG